MIATSKRYEEPVPYGWFCVALNSGLGDKEVRAIKYFGKKLVLFRTESGEPNLLDAICPHLGAHLGHGGKVKGESIACPFHGWEYNGEGQVTSVPYAKNIPPKVRDGKQCIHAYPLRNIRGLLYAWYHPNNLPPMWEPDPVEEMDGKEWLDFQQYEFIVKSNIQEMGENAVDTAHFVYVHGVEDVPQGDIHTTDHCRYTDVGIRVPDLENPTPAGEPPAMVDGTLYTRSIGAGQSVVIFDTYFYNLMIGSSSPIDDEHVHLRFSFAVPKGQSDMQVSVGQLAIDEVVRQVNQDIPIWENKEYLPNPVLCDGDGPIAKYRKWFRQFYA